MTFVNLWEKPWFETAKCLAPFVTVDYLSSHKTECRTCLGLDEYLEPPQWTTFHSIQFQRQISHQPDILMELEAPGPETRIFFSLHGFLLCLSGGFSDTWSFWVKMQNTVLRNVEMLHYFDCKNPINLMVCSQLGFCVMLGFGLDGATVVQMQDKQGVWKTKSDLRKHVWVIFLYLQQASIHAQPHHYNITHTHTHTVSGPFHSMPSTSCVCGQRADISVALGKH